MKSYERRFTIEYLELCMRIKNLEDYIDRRTLGKDDGTCTIDTLITQLNVMKSYKSILTARASIEGIHLQELEW